MKKLKGNFTIIPNEYITDENPDCYEYRILCFLCKLSDEENTSYPSYETIARKTSISISKVKRAIEHLIDMGYISKKTRTKINGGCASNIYTVSEKPARIIHWLSRILRTVFLKFHHAMSQKYKTVS